MYRITDWSGVGKKPICSNYSEAGSLCMEIKATKWQSVKMRKLSASHPLLVQIKGNREINAS